MHGNRAARVLAGRERTFFVEHSEIGLFLRAGHGKSRLHPLARGSYYVGLYDENFKGLGDFYSEFDLV